VGQVGGSGAPADGQGGGDLPVGVPGSHHAQHLPFAGAQPR
jgi:hypothetical protein